MNWRGVVVGTMLAGFSTLPSSVGSAQEWELLPGMTSAKLAASGWEIKAAAGISWPSNLHGVITFWETTIDRTRVTMRCIDNFDEYANPVGAICSQIIAGKD